MKKGIMAKLLTCMLVGAASGCSVSTSPTDVASNTPVYYTENQFFFQGDTATLISPQPTTAPSNTTVAGLQTMADPAVKLLQTWDWSPDPTIAFNAGDPMAVILQSVRLPDDLPGLGTRDIAVILDVNMGADKGLQSFVAYYQRDVPPGQMLNFSNLTVYATTRLDPTVAPYFRVRVLDVKAERNAHVAKLLEESSQLNGEITGLLPHPLIPAVSVAIQAAGAILSNQQDQTLLDFQVQLYQASQANSAGNGDLGRLCEGRWLVLGRERGQTSDFWNVPLYLDRRTGEIVVKDSNWITQIQSEHKKENMKDSDYADHSEEDVYVPYVAVVLAKTDLQVPSVVLDRAQTLLQLVTSPAGKTDPETLGSALSSLSGATNVYTVEREVTSNPNFQSMADLMDLAERDQQSAGLTSNGGTRLLGAEDQNELLAFAKNIILKDSVPNGYDISSEKGLIVWWDKGGDKGSFDNTGHWVVPGSLKWPAPTTDAD